MGIVLPSRACCYAFNPSWSMPRLMRRRVGGVLVLTGGCPVPLGEDDYE